MRKELNVFWIQSLHQGLLHSPFLSLICFQHVHVQLLIQWQERWPSCADQAFRCMYVLAARSHWSESVVVEASEMAETISCMVHILVILPHRYCSTISMDLKTTEDSDNDSSCGGCANCGWAGTMGDL